MTISQAAEKLQVSEASLRTWERQGLIPKVQRTPCGLRNYAEKDLDNVRNYLSNRTKN